MKTQSQEPDADKSDVVSFEGYYLYTRPGVIVEVDDDGEETRQAHRPKFIPVNVRIEGGRWIVEPRREEDGDNRNLQAVALTSIRGVTLIPAFIKNPYFFPLLIGLVSLFILIRAGIWQGLIAGIEGLVNSLGEIPPFPITIHLEVLVGVFGLLLVSLSWFGQVLHKVWRRLVYSMAVVSTKNRSFILYFSTRKESEVTSQLLQTGLPVHGSFLVED